MLRIKFWIWVSFILRFCYFPKKLVLVKIQRYFFDITSNFLLLLFVFATLLANKLTQPNKLNHIPFFHPLLVHRLINVHVAPKTHHLPHRPHHLAFPLPHLYPNLQCSQRPQCPPTLHPNQPHNLLISTQFISLIQPIHHTKIHQNQSLAYFIHHKRISWPDFLWFLAPCTIVRRTLTLCFVKVQIFHSSFRLFNFINFCVQWWFYFLDTHNTFIFIV